MLHIRDVSDKQILHKTVLQIKTGGKRMRNFAFRKDEHFTFRKDEHFACWGWTLFCLHCLNWAADARAVLLCHRSWHRLMCSEITFWFVWPLEIVPCDPALAQCPSVHLGTVTFGFHHRPVVTMSPSTQHPENPTLSLWNFLYFLFYYTFPTLARSVGVLLQTNEVRIHFLAFTLQSWFKPENQGSQQELAGLCCANSSPIGVCTDNF